MHTALYVQVCVYVERVKKSLYWMCAVRIIHTLKKQQKKKKKKTAKSMQRAFWTFMALSLSQQRSECITLVCDFRRVLYKKQRRKPYHHHTRDFAAVAYSTVCTRPSSV